MNEQLEVQSKQEQIKNSVTPERQNEVTNFVKQLDDTKKRGIVDALDTNGKTIIGNIENNLKEKLKDKNIHRDDPSDPMVINFTEAINAFETDLKEYSQKTGGNVLSDDLITVAKLKNDIIEKKTAIEATNTEQRKLDLLLITPINKNSAINFFEGDKKVYDMFMTGLSADGTPIEIKNTEAKNELYDRLEGYIGEEKMKGVTDIKLGKTSDNFGKRFPINNRVITYKENGEDKSIIQGNNNTMQKLLVQKNEESIKNNINLDRTKETWLDKDKKETKEKDKKVYTETALNAFDDIGNYEGFSVYISTKGPDYVSKNFPNIISGIKEYEPKVGSRDLEDGNGDSLKNGYANVLTEYIINNPSLIQPYIKYLTTENLNILGVDKETRTANYNRLFFADVTNNILRPEINDILSKLGDSDKKALLMQIANIKNMIENKDKLSPTETLSKGLDSLIDAFGPMLFSILKMFGFGKGSLLKMFPSSKEKINEIFGKEYGLSKEAVAAIRDISGNKGGEIDIKDKRSNPPTAKELKKSFGETDEEINTYINKLTDGKKYYQHINVSVLKQGLDQYNKKKGIEININDIVTITTDNTTKKQSITEIKKQDIFQGVMENMLKNDTIRANIAGANIDLQISRKEKKINTDSNEQGAKIDTESTSYGYRIKSQQDIARYLTASLFSNKDLSYVMTENELHNPVVIGKEEPSDKPEVAHTAELKFIDIYAKDGIVTEAGAKMMIHEVLDYKTAPNNLLFTPKGKSSRKIEKKEDVELKDKAKVPSYVYTEEPNKGTRVQIGNGDKIEKVPAEKSIADKRIEVKTELDKEPTKTAKTVFEGATYKLDNANIYEIEIQKVSNLFTEEKTYDDLISEVSTPTLGAMVQDNMSEIKNMFTFWNLQITAKNTTYTDKIGSTISTEQLKNIDTTKQIFAVKEIKGKTITIAVKKKGTDATVKEGTITLSKDTNKKLISTRTETAPSATT